MKIYNTIQNSGTVMQFLDQNLKKKKDEQLKHRSEILWIYSITVFFIRGSLQRRIYYKIWIFFCIQMAVIMSQR